MNAILLLFLVAPTLAILGIGSTQSVAVRGRLFCNGQSAADVKVKLKDDGLIREHKLDETKTDKYGYFEVSGSKKEVTNIDPKVFIYHKCNYNGPCYKKFGMKIPDNFITRGATPSKVYDIGTINLANQFDGQSTDCIN